MLVPWRDATVPSAVSMSWKRSHPLNSSMINRYFTSDRFSSGTAGSGLCK
jgi:hypothetical protein